jgi:hypothetical protein
MSAAIGVTDPVLQSISSSPSSIASLPKGTTQQLTISGVYSDGSTTALANDASTYSSSATGVATVSSSGLVTGVAATGTATITVTYSGQTTTVGVTAAAAAVTGVQVRLKNYVGAAPGPTTVAVDTNMIMDLAAYSVMSDGSAGADVTASTSWSSSSTANATITTGGRITGAAAGSSTITATYSGFTGTYVVTVNSKTCNVVLNEVASRGPNGGNDEFVEIYNPCSSTIDITGWKLVYRSSAATSDSNTLITFGAAHSPSLAPGAFRVYAGSTGTQTVSTNNGTFVSGISDTSAVGIRNASNALVDSVGFGLSNNTNTFQEGYTSGQNLASPNSSSAPYQSVHRKLWDGKDTNVTFGDWVVTTTRTPGASNR